MSGAYSLFNLPLSQWIAAGIAPEGLEQHAIKAEFARLAELLDTNRHSFMAGRGLCAVGPKQAVPPGQVKAEVAIGLAREN
jgi:hypothetical protein